MTRKITRGLARLAAGLDDCLYLGNLDAKRDWGHARDYVEMQWLMLQGSVAKDYVIATGRQVSVRSFVLLAAKALGIEIQFSGEGVEEIGTVVGVNAHHGPKTKVGSVIIRVDPRYFRPAEVESLLGDASLAAKELNWKPRIELEQLCEEMVLADLASIKGG